MEALLDAPIPSSNQLFRKCKHTCEDRATCGHKCCLVGVKNGKTKLPKGAPSLSSSKGASSSSSSINSGGGGAAAAAAAATGGKASSTSTTAASSSSTTKKKVKKVPVSSSSLSMESHKIKKFQLRQFNGTGHQIGTIALNTSEGCKQTIIGRQEVAHSLKFVPGSSGAVALPNPPTKTILTSQNFGTKVIIGKKVSRGAQPKMKGVVRVPLDHAGIIGDSHCTIKYGYYNGTTTIEAAGATFLNGKQLAKGKCTVLPEVDGGIQIELKAATGSALAARATTLAAFKFEMHTRVHDVTVRAVGSDDEHQLIEIRDHNREISSEHCKIVYHRPSNTFKITDISKNGVYVNKARITPNTPWPISVGSEVAIGGSSKTPVGFKLNRLHKRVFAFTLEAAK